MDNTRLEKSDKRVARPLKVLVPLIKQKLKEGDAAAQNAGMPYFVEAGEMLLEAKATNENAVRPMSWGDWLNRNFHLSQGTARVYMAAARQTARGAARFETLNEVRGDTRKFGHAPTWTEPVKDVLNRLNTASFNLHARDISLAKERKLEHELALNLIDIGYKVLAVKMHPDKSNGSHEAMRRLNKVRARLKEAA